jgi:hypothetical protein
MVWTVNDPARMMEVGTVEHFKIDGPGIPNSDDSVSGCSVGSRCDLDRQNTDLARAPISPAQSVDSTFYYAIHADYCFW